MSILRVNDDELELILIGLRAISPSGGGSAPFTLYRKLAADTGGDVSENREQRARYAVLAELQTHLTENPETTLENILADLEKAIR